MIDNFNVIDEFLIFENGYFYKFEALIRNTDGYNPLFYEGISNTNKNILIKNWFVDSQEYYEKMKSQMKALCDMTGARLYVTLDRKENNKLIECIYNKSNEMLKGLVHGVNYGTKKIKKVVSSCSSLVECSDKGSRTLMFDVDSKDKLALEIVKLYLTEKKVKYYVLNTRQGYHIVCYKKFDTKNLNTDIVKCYSNFLDRYDVIPKCDRPPLVDRADSYVCNYIRVNPNQLGLVYHPEKNFINDDGNERKL